MYSHGEIFIRHYDIFKRNLQDNIYNRILLFVKNIQSFDQHSGERLYFHKGNYKIFRAEKQWKYCTPILLARAKAGHQRNCVGLIHYQRNICGLGAPGWCSQLSICLGLKSWSQDPGMEPHIGIPAQQGVGLFLWLYPLHSPPPLVHAL